MTQPSARLTRAAAAERAELARSRRRLQARRDAVRKELDDLERQLVELDVRDALLERVAPGSSRAGAAEPARPEPAHSEAPRSESGAPRRPAASHSPGAPPSAHVHELRPGSAAARPLRGTAIRETAVRVLAARPQSRRPIHYRDWIALLEAEGYVVVGKDPPATFLTQVSRSPVVAKTTRAGMYELDHDAPERFRHRIAELQRELRRIASAPPQAGDLAGGRAQRQALMTELARAERALEEADRSLAPGAAHVAAANG